MQFIQGCRALWIRHWIWQGCRFCKIPRSAVAQRRSHSPISARYLWVAGIIIHVTSTRWFAIQGYRAPCTNTIVRVVYTRQTVVADERAPSALVLKTEIFLLLEQRIDQRWCREPPAVYHLLVVTWFSRSHMFCLGLSSPFGYSLSQ